MSSVPTLGYWNIQGLGQPIRYLLKYAHVDFIDKRHELEEGVECYDTKQWKTDKTKLGLDFPNLPYYIDDNIKLSQSSAILRYLGRKHGLVATDEQSLVRQDLIERQIYDIRCTLFPVIQSKDFENDKRKYIDEFLINQLNLLSKFLGQNDWFAGRLTYVDFIVFEILDWFRLLSPETIDKFPNLSQYLNRFESLAPIKAYMSSPEFKRWPISDVGQNAKWGYMDPNMKVFK